MRLRLGLGRLIVMRLIGLRLVKARILRLGGIGRLLAGRNRLLLEGRRLRCRLGRIPDGAAADCGCGAAAPWGWGTEAGAGAPGWRRVGFLCCRGLLRGLFEPWEAG